MAQLWVLCLCWNSLVWHSCGYCVCAGTVSCGTAVGIVSVLELSRVVQLWVLLLSIAVV